MEVMILRGFGLGRFECSPSHHSQPAEAVLSPDSRVSQDLQLRVGLGEAALLGLHQLVADQRGRRAVGADVVEHDVLGGGVEVAPPEHAVVERHWWS